MKYFFNILIMIAASSVLFFACGTKHEPDQIIGWTTYIDPLMKFEIKYPANWFVAHKQIGDVLTIYSSQSGMNRFRFETGKYHEGLPCAKIALIPIKLENGYFPDSIFESRKMFDKSVYSDPEKVALDGVEAIKRFYAFELNDGNFEGEIYIASKDSAIATMLIFESFGSTFQNYKKNAFDEILKTIKLATKPEDKPDTIRLEMPPDPPSDTLKTVSGDGYSISIPDNFNKERGMYIGARRGDSYIKVDVLDASKQSNLKKIVEDTRSNIPSASAAQSLKLSGLDAFKFSYKPGGQVDGEMYFVLKNNKLFRITLNWFRGEANMFKPIFQKCALSLKLD